jgi:ribosomal protein S18 acetylase RimI-like enzyme
VTVRTISDEELDQFAAPHAGEWVKETLAKFWQEGRSSPGQCFLAEDERGIAGRVAYWSQAWNPRALFIFGLHLPWKSNYIEVGRKLFGVSMSQMRARGAKSVTHYFYAEYDGHVEERHRLMQALGFEQTQDKIRYLWTGGSLPADADRLVYRNMPEAGEEAFRDAVQGVTVGTLDREDQDRVNRLGHEAAAKEYMHLLEDADDPKHDWWLLGYGPEGKLVGLVVPQPLDDEEGTIGYIGVVPDRRGQGYVMDLLVKATRLIQSHGLAKSVAEVDRLNVPMRSALERAGYNETGPLWAYRFKL